MWLLAKSLPTSATATGECSLLCLLITGGGGYFFLVEVRVPNTQLEGYGTWGAALAC